MKKFFLATIALCALHGGYIHSVLTTEEIVSQYGGYDQAFDRAIRDNDMALVHEVGRAARLAKVDLFTIKGSGWIHLAVAHNGVSDSHLDIIEYLVSHGCDPFTKIYGIRPFSIASPAAQNRMWLVILSANA